MVNQLQTSPGQHCLPMELITIALTVLNCSPIKSTSLSVPLVNSVVQVMFRAGSPSAVQFKLIGGPPSSTTCSWKYGSDHQVRCTDLRANTVLREFHSFADPPERVQLQVIEDTVCKGVNVIFNCSAADANPVGIIYHLYENNVMISNSTSTGILNRTMTTRGVFGYSCKVRKHRWNDNEPECLCHGQW